MNLGKCKPMLLVKTKIGPSKIHGIGLFADENIPRGKVVWKFNPIIDKAITIEETKTLPGFTQEYIQKYSFFNDGKYILCGDYAIFTNHSDNPNLESVDEMSVAAHDIQNGEELTDNYNSYDEEPE